MSIEEGKSKKNITDILKAATAENDAVRNEGDDKRRTYEHTLFSLASGTAETEAVQPKAEPSAPKTRLGAETDKIVSAYSNRKPVAELSSTAELKELLGTTSDKTLLPEQPQGVGSGKASKLGSMLEDAKMRTAEIGAKTQTIPRIKDISAANSGSRFTDPIGHVHPRAPIQESMFDLDGDAPATAETVEIETVKFDKDYAELSSKIASGEIDFGAAEPEDDAQTVMAAETADLVAINPQKSHFTTAPVDMAVTEQPEQDKSDNSEQDKSDNRGAAFEMMKDKTEGDDEQDFDAALGKMGSDRKQKTKKQSKRKPKEYEYATRDQNNDVYAMLRKALRVSRLKALACALFLAGIIFLEAATFGSTERAAFLHQGRYGNLYILIDLQLLFFSALVMLKNIKNGFTAILAWKPSTDSLLFVSLIATTAYSIVMLIVDPTSETLKLYSLPAATACFCKAVSDYMCCKKDVHCFKIIAKKHKKFAALEQDSTSPEAIEFSHYLSPSSSVYTVKRTDFVSGMFHRINTRTKSEQVLGFVIPVILIMALVLFGALAVMGKPLLDAYAAATLLVLISTPLTAFFMVTLPIVRINRIGKHTSSAFVGNSVAEEYADAGVLSFADTEVYPSKNIRVVSVKAYGNFRLDNIIPSLASAFELLGGPLAPVLKDMVDGNYPTPRYSRLVESAADGVCVALNGNNMYIGKHSYMRRNGIDAPLDTGDTSYEKKNGTVMFVAVNDTIAAKVYLVYVINERFDPLLRDMFRAGLCLGVKTLDPNITQDMLKRDIAFKKCPITIIKSTRFGESSEEVSTIDSGIVTNGTLHTFLSMFALCDKARHVIRSNIVITMASIFMSFAAVCFFALTASVFDLTSIYALLFQLVWLVPVAILTFFL